MAHISDPIVGLGTSEDGRATSNILVLDPDETVLETCGRILQDEGLEVKVTDSVKEALAELENEFYDVVIAAVDVPEMTGQELLKEIKYRQPEVLVIVTTPFKDTEEAAETVKLGAYDYIPKPFGPHQISLMVLTALQTRSSLTRAAGTCTTKGRDRFFRESRWPSHLQTRPIGSCTTIRRLSISHHKTVTKLSRERLQGTLRSGSPGKRRGVGRFQVAGTTKGRQNSQTLQLQTS